MATKTDKLYEDLYNAGPDPVKFLKALGPLLVGVFPAGVSTVPVDDPSMMSYPPAHDPETALDNARNGYGIEGIRGGRLLNDEFLKAKIKGLEGILARKELFGIPADMVEFGWMTNMTEFQDTVGLGGGPFPYAKENFSGKGLAQYVTEYWIAKAAGTHSGGAKG